MRFLSVCSGIEAASVASKPLGWTAAGFAEIDPFCCSLLREKYPDVPNYGDFTTITAEQLGSVDAIVGGTPCQDFSVAGKRAGLDGERGNLTLEFIHLVERIHPRWVFWENVPGVLSIDGGRAFGAFLGALGQCGYGFAYRVLNARHFGIPQFRRRVFVVGYLGDWRPPGSVLFESQVLCRDTAEGISPREGTEGLLPCITKCGIGARREEEAYVVVGDRIRHITPIEAERGQGFPDDYTRVQYGRGYAADSRRYAALGNSWAVPCVRWIFERMDAVDKAMRCSANGTGPE